MSNSIKTVLSGTFAGTSLKPREKSVKELWASGIAFIFIGCAMLASSAPAAPNASRIVCGGFLILLGIMWLIFMYKNRPKSLTLEQDERCKQAYAGLLKDIEKDATKETVAHAKVEALIDSLAEIPLPMLEKIKEMLEEEQRSRANHTM